MYSLNNVVIIRHVSTAFSHSLVSDSATLTVAPLCMWDFSDRKHWRLFYSPGIPSDPEINYVSCIIGGFFPR